MTSFPLLVGHESRYIYTNAPPSFDRSFPFTCSHGFTMTVLPCSRQQFCVQGVQTHDLFWRYFNLVCLKANAQRGRETVIQ